MKISLKHAAEQLKKQKPRVSATNGQGTGLEGVRPRRFLVHYGEIGLKGRNRFLFENKLKQNISRRLSEISESHKIIIHHKYLEVVVQNAETDKIAEALSHTFGIMWFAPAYSLPRSSSIKDIQSKLLEIANPIADKSRTFRIRSKRADKTFSPTSQELDKLLGGVLLDNTAYEKVQLENPDDEYHIEIEQDQIFFYTEKIAGPGGLPVGISGRVLVLFSGGIDSTIAAYMMAKRGCQIDLLHFYVNKPKPESKIIRLATAVREFTGPGRLFTAPYLHFNMSVLSAETQYELALFRRFMLRTAELICESNHLDAIATGDSLGQVASQTLSNIRATDDALKDRVCFRPLIGLDKNDITKIAKDINTFEISNEPQKDCCSLIDHHAKTRVSLGTIREEESKLTDYDKIIEQTLAELEQI